MTQEGWRCPICGRVFAPWVPECTYPHTTNKFNTQPEVRISQITWPHKDTLTGDPIPGLGYTSFDAK